MGQRTIGCGGQGGKRAIANSSRKQEAQDARIDETRPAAIVIGAPADLYKTTGFVERARRDVVVGYFEKQRSSPAPPRLVDDRRRARPIRYRVRRRSGTTPSVRISHSCPSPCANAKPAAASSSQAMRPKNPANGRDLRDRRRRPRVIRKARADGGTTAARRVPRLLRRTRVRGGGSPLVRRARFCRRSVRRPQIERFYRSPRSPARHRRSAARTTPSAGGPGLRRRSCDRGRRAQGPRGSPRRRRSRARRAAASTTASTTAASASGSTAVGSQSGRPSRSKSWTYRSARRLSRATRRQRSSRTASGTVAAAASKLLTPINGRRAASAIPRAAASPTRMPVKLPGPIVTAIRSSAETARPAARIASSTIGSNASAWPWAMSACRSASTSSPAATAAEQPLPAESTARISGSAATGRCVPSAAFRRRPRPSDGADLDHFGDVVPQHVFDARL